MNPSSGIVIQGYRLVRPIGSGGFGEVWLARAEATGAWKALKWISGGTTRHLDQELGALKRYSSEVGNARSTHLVPIEHISMIEDSLILVMPLADGTTEDPSQPDWEPVTLRTLFERHGAHGTWFSLDEIKNVMGGIIAGAAWLSEKGLLHRDIKPENILFIGGEPALADFGLVAEDMTMVSMRGTPHHAAPSWYLESGGNADQWGCAIILYQLLTGNAPDKIAKPKYLTPAAGMGKLAAEDLREWKRLHHLVLRATSEEPGERFQGLEAFRKAVSLSSAGSATSSQVWKSPVVYTGGVLLLLVLLSLGVFAFLGQEQAKPNVEVRPMEVIPRPTPETQVAQRLVVLSEATSSKATPTENNPSEVVQSQNPTPEATPEATPSQALTSEEKPSTVLSKESTDVTPQTGSNGTRAESTPVRFYSKPKKWGDPLPEDPVAESEIADVAATIRLASPPKRPGWMDHPQHIYSSEEVTRMNQLVRLGNKEGVKKLIEANEARYRELVKKLPPGAGFSWIMEKMRFPEKE